MTFNFSRGFTLIETIIGVALFAIIGTAIYFSYSNLFDSLLIDKTRAAAIAVLENEIETVRNIPYPDVGVKGGAPSGNLLPEKTISYGGAQFKVKINVKNIDDSFDGTLTGIPQDMVPSDYKLVQVEVSCLSSCTMAPISMTTTVAPKNLEKATKNGALFINVFDASGIPLSGADMSIVNNQVNPNININDTTNASGSLNFVDIATSSSGYHIVVSKTGYSTDQTYPAGGVSNPNPINLDATVREQDLTKIGFAIDKLATLNFKTQDSMCKSIPNVDFNMTGDKLIGTNPNMPKYSVNHQTDSSGLEIINNLEWDTYSFTNLETSYDVGGMIPLSPLSVLPSDNISMTWILEPKMPASLLVTVLDEDENSVPDASVTLNSGSFIKTQYTNRRYFGQTDWSGGQYASQTGKIETENPGQLTVQFTDGKYATSSEELISSIFDMGASDTTFYKLRWNPISQPAQTTLKFQIATNNDNLTWNFIGPNGNSSAYYTISDTQLHSSHNNKKYLRYKIIMQTQNDQSSPKLEDLDIEFSSSCISSGQTLFQGLSSGNYTMTVSKSGYDDTQEDISITNNWQSFETTLYVP